MCTHDNFTRPQTFRVRAEGSQEIIGEGLMQVCLNCCFTRGTVKSGSMWKNLPAAMFTAEGGHDIEGHARRALLKPAAPVDPTQAA